MQQAHGRTALTPIPEASGLAVLDASEHGAHRLSLEAYEPSGSIASTIAGAVGEKETKSGRGGEELLDPAPSDRADSELSESMTPRLIESTADERAERAAERAAVKFELPAWRSVERWPAHREASGRLMLRASTDVQAEGRHAVCRVRDGVLILSIEQWRAAGEMTEKVVAEVPVEALAVGLQRGRSNMLTLATVHENKMFDEIYCFSANSASRNRWIAVFRRMGVAVFDLRG